MEDKFRKRVNNANQSVQFSRSVVSDSATPWTAARQASLSIINSRSLLKLMPVELVMPSNHLILCCPVLLLPSIFRSVRVSFPMSQFLASGSQTIGASASVLPMNIQDWFPLGLIGLISLLSKGLLSLLQHYNSKETSQRIRQKVNVNIELLCEHWQVWQANWSDSYPPLLRNFTRIMAAVVNLLSATTLDKMKGLVLANQTTLGMDLPAVATSIR